MIALVTAILLMQDAGPLREVDELRREVDLLRTINALELTRDQLGSVVTAADEAAKRVEELAAGAKGDLDALVAALKELRDAIAKGGAADEEQERKIGERQRAVGELMRGVGESQEKLIARLREILNEKQWKKLQVVGRPDPLRPMREGFSRMVLRAKEDADADPAEMFVEQMKRMSKPLGLSEKDAQEEAERIVKIFDEAVDDEKFEEKADEYVRCAFDEGKVGEAAKKMGPPPGETNRRLGQVLLEKRTIAALKLRLEGMK